MKKHNLIGGLFWFVLGICICIESVKLNLGDFHKPGAGFTPFLAGAFLGIVGLILTLYTISKRLEEEEVNSISVKGAKKFYF